MPLTLQGLVVTKGHTYLKKRAAEKKLYICMTIQVCVAIGYLLKRTYICAFQE